MSAEQQKPRKSRPVQVAEQIKSWVVERDLRVNGGVKTYHCGGAKSGQFGVCALERAALI